MSAQLKPPDDARVATATAAASAGAIALALALLAAPLQGQPPETRPPATPLPATSTAQDTAARLAPPTAPLRTLSDVVLFADGQPARGATVVARPVAGVAGASTRVAVTDRSGRFTLDSLTAGSYDVRVLHPQAARGFVRRVAIDGADRGEFIVERTPQPWLGWTLIFLGLYLGTILVVRWHNIARSIHVMLVRQLMALSTRLQTEVVSDDPRIDSLRRTVWELQRDFDPKEWGKWGHRRRLGEFLFWSRGRENAGWVAVHEIERQLAAFLAPPEYVESYLVWAEAQLRVVGTAPALALADAIGVSLLPPAPDDPRGPGSREKARKALLGRAISVIYTERDMTFSTLMEWHNKASWLIIAAVVIIGFLAAAAGNAVLFLAGGAGGFLSRVMRALKREDVPLDYGASWTTLFLSPLFGALAGWFGIAMIALATSDEVNLLGAAFAIIDWYHPLSPFALAVAFLLGFSERFFDAIVGAVERHAAGAAAAEQAALISTGRPAPAPPPQSREQPAMDPGVGGVPTEVPGEHLAEESEDGTEDGEVAEPAAQAMLELPAAGTPGQIVSGRIVLARPTERETVVVLASSHAAYEIAPPDVVIRPGESEAAFELVPIGDAGHGTVHVTAVVDGTELHGVVEYR